MAALPALPEPISNNAVAALPTARGPVLYSFLGLRAGKTYADTNPAPWQLDPGANPRRAQPP
ncbi:MAG: galactose oxidase, partial [Pseudomonadota bacterium]